MATKSNKGKSGDYEVGHGKPPKHSQFKKGKSGNPGGRQKESLNFKTLLKSVAEEEVPVGANGKRKPMLVAILTRQALAALQGSPRAMEDFLNRVERHFGNEDDSRPAELPEEDEQVLREWEEKLRRLPQNDNGDAGEHAA